MTDKANLSVIIVTFNEEKRIRRCLASVAWADEIIVVDQSSGDRTVDCCREYTDKVFIVGHKGFCEPDRPVAVSKAANDWVLYIDADEEVTPALRGEIEALIRGEPEHRSYYIPRKNIYLGQWIRHSGWYPGYVLRLFRKGAVTFSERIHGETVPSGSCGYLKEPLTHHTYDSLDEHRRKLDRYTDVLAGQSYAQGERVALRNAPWRFFFLPAAYLLQRYLIQGGILDGVRGLVIAGFTFRTVFLTNVKLWRLQRGARR